MSNKKNGKIEDGVKVGNYPDTKGSIARAWRSYFRRCEAELYDERFRDSAERKLAIWGTRVLIMPPDCYHRLNGIKTRYQ